MIALGHDALGTTLPEQKVATKRAAKAVADLIKDDYQVAITHSNGPPNQYDTQSHDGASPSLYRLYPRSHVRMQRHEPGIRGI